MLKPRLQVASLSRVKPLDYLQPDATPRLRGRAGVAARHAWRMDNPLCVECLAQGRVNAEVEVDHIVPLWKGGADDATNLQSLCHDHHAAKTAREADERARLGGGGSNLWG